MSIKAQKEVLIVNLSSIHTLHSIESGIDAFGRLYRMTTTLDAFGRPYQPYDSKKERCCWNPLGFFTTVYDRAWVAWIYLSHKQKIDDYKQGRTTTENFLNTMLSMFDFLKSNPKAKELLVETWNATVEVTEEDKQKLTFLREMDCPVYLVSNTNELMATKLLESFFGEEGKALPDLTVGEGKAKIIPIEKNIYFVPSYRWGLYKTDGLIENLCSEISSTEDKCILVSQHDADIQKAKELGMQYFPANNFFHESKPKLD